ncbi:MAG: hypothetical protein H7647_02330 [Candidatus Heimdallarchaeota archaeon]|nr:hypothetical protein [Candidatus Heimdallarchaeota archaeon]MCK4253264.1 hypothetical protein [Candidatus Heimdallarchaeota archaeon]
MTIGIVIPFRGTDLDKSRLREDMDEISVKYILNRMTQQVIFEIMKLDKNVNLYVLSKNKVSFEGNYQVGEDQGKNLNDSLQKFTSKMSEDIIMIIMADLPLINKSRINVVLETVEQEKKVVIAPAEDYGTSILCFNRNTSFPFFYGKKSAKRLANYLTKTSINYQVLEYDYCYQDIDTLKDLIKLNQNSSLPEWLKSYFKEVI